MSFLVYNRVCNQHFLQRLLHSKETTDVFLEKVNATLVRWKQYFHLALKNVVICLFLKVLDADIPHLAG